MSTIYDGQQHDDPWAGSDAVPMPPQLQVPIDHSPEVLAATEQENLARLARHEQLLANALARQTQEEYLKLRARDEAKAKLLIEQKERAKRESGNHTRVSTGGGWLLDVPDLAPTIWGKGSEILWARGEALMIAGPQGVGKTTLAGQILKGCLSLQDEVLGYPIAGAEQRVLYLAMDRPQQAQRNLARMFAGMEDHRAYLEEMLRVWAGPPPQDFAVAPETLLEMAREHSAEVVFIDSLKDAAVGLSKDEVGAGYNRARQLALAEGVQIIELHHFVKNGSDGGKPNNINGVYGSTWLTSGAGSVIMLWGDPGDPEVEFKHLKQPMDEVGPFKVEHNNRTGVSVRVYEESKDLLALARRCKTTGISAKEAAVVLFEHEEGDKVPTKDINKARRRLDRYVDENRLHRVDPTGRGAGNETRWFSVISDASNQ